MEKAEVRFKGGNENKGVNIGATWRKAAVPSKHVVWGWW